MSNTDYYYDDSNVESCVIGDTDDKHIEASFNANDDLVVDNFYATDVSDPFDIVAAREARNGVPMAFNPLQHLELSWN